jgi:hypothetical protein
MIADSAMAPSSIPERQGDVEISRPAVEISLRRGRAQALGVLTQS